MLDILWLLAQAVPQIDAESIPGTVVLPTWLLVATIVALFSSLGIVAWRGFGKYVELLERLLAAIELLERATTALERATAAMEARRP